MATKNLNNSVLKALTTEEIEQCKQFAKSLLKCDINLSRENIIVIILLVIKNNKNIINDINKENVLNVIVSSFTNIYHIENLKKKCILPLNYEFYDKTLIYDICVFAKSCVDKYGNDILIKIYESIYIYNLLNRLKSNNKLTNILYGDDVYDMMVNRTFDYYYKLNGYKNDIEYVDFCVDCKTLTRVSKFTSNYSVCDDFINIKDSIYYYKLLLNELNPNRFKDSIDDGNYDISIIKPYRFNIEKESDYINTSKEHQQILKQIKLLKIGGIGSCMIPWYNIYDNNPDCINFRTELLKNVKILSCYAVYDNLLEFYEYRFGCSRIKPIIACCMIIYQKIEKLDNPVKQVIDDSANYLYCGYSRDDIENIKRNYSHNESKFTIDIKDNIMIDYYYPSVINKVNGEIETEEQFKTASIDNIKFKMIDVINTYFKPSKSDNSNVRFSNEINKIIDINDSKVYKWKEFQIKKLMKEHNMYPKKHFSDYDEFNNSDSDSESDSDNESNNSDSDNDDELIETTPKTIELLLKHKFGTYDWEVIKNHLNDYIKYPLTCWCNTD